MALVETETPSFTAAVVAEKQPQKNMENNHWAQLQLWPPNQAPGASNSNSWKPSAQRTAGLRIFCNQPVRCWPEAWLLLQVTLSSQQKY